MPFVLPGVVKIPARNSFEEGAMLEPVNTVLKAVKRLALLPSDNVLVAGQGPIGLIFTRILKLQGINVLATDLMPQRLRLAQQWGAKWVSNPNNLNSVAFQTTPSKVKKRGSFSKAHEISHRPSSIVHPRSTIFDAAILAVPSDAALKQAVELVRGAGQVLLFAHTKRGYSTDLDLASICVDEKDLIGSYSADFTLQKEVARLVFSRKLDVRSLISHRFDLENAVAAVELAAHPTPESFKIIITSGGRKTRISQIFTD
ncbi:MAG TPA: zinc-binding dehydrogenase [Verrucomicrobiae bacterium]|nr:zinc-binding dehydrogenase [Verrucomicrobiae bacterium]